MVDHSAGRLPFPPRLPVICGEWLRNGHDVIRVTLDTFNGREIIDLRVWFRDSAGDWRPSRSGLTLGIRPLPTLVAALTEANARARILGLVAPDHNERSS
jgi:transcriptional coactivator p15 (PC4)